jgi:hypothetical protein
MVTDVDDLELPIPVIALSDPDWLTTLTALVEREVMGRP